MNCTLLTASLHPTMKMDDSGPSEHICKTGKLRGFTGCLKCADRSPVKASNSEKEVKK
jgi:hypothetical protein